MKLHYSILEYGENSFDFDNVFTSPNLGEYSSSTKLWDLETFSEELARHVFNNRDGWDETWPLTFRLWTEDATCIGDFVVEMERVPSFYSVKVEANNEL